MKHSIRVIEDNEQNRYLMQFLLKAKGRTVILAFMAKMA